MTKHYRVSKTSADLVDAFGDAAMYHGWQQEMGTGKAVDVAEASYREEKTKLLRRIATLEAKLVKARQPPDVGGNYWPKS